MAKYTYDFKHKIERERERDRDRDREKEKRNLTKQFTLHSAEAYSEPFPTSEQGGYVTGGSYFHKNIHLRCLKRFWIRLFPSEPQKQSNHKGKSYHPRSSLINNLIVNLFTTISIWCTYLQACWKFSQIISLTISQTCNRLMFQSYSLKKSG